MINDAGSLYMSAFGSWIIVGLNKNAECHRCEITYVSYPGPWWCLRSFLIVRCSRDQERYSVRKPI